MAVPFDAAIPWSKPTCMVYLCLRSAHLTQARTEWGEARYSWRWLVQAAGPRQANKASVVRQALGELQTLGLVRISQGDRFFYADLIHPYYWPVEQWAKTRDRQATLLQSAEALSVQYQAA